MAMRTLDAAPLPPDERLWLEPRLEHARARLPTEASDFAAAAGMAMTIDEAMDEAAQQLSGLGQQAR